MQLASPPGTLRHHLLGRTGLRVSDFCLGTMTFGEEWGFGADRAESRRIFDAYVEAGGNFLDTANSYTGGTSERLVGEFVAGERDRFVIATKYTHAERPGDPNAGGNHRKSLRQAVHASLRRLQTDHVDLLWVHAWDGTTAVDEVMRALDDLVHHGDVLAIGLSDTPAWVASQAGLLAHLRGWTPLAAVQFEYSLLARDAERDLLPMAHALGLGMLAWAPLGAGLLSGKYLDAAVGDGPARLRDVPFYAGLRDARTDGIARRVRELATTLDCTPAQLALAWVRAQHPALVPIVGARSAAQLRDSLGAADLALPDDVRHQLDDATRQPLGFPHDFLRAPLVQQMIHGGTETRLRRTEAR